MHIHKVKPNINLAIRREVLRTKKTERIMQRSISMIITGLMTAMIIVQILG